MADIEPDFQVLRRQLEDLQRRWSDEDQRDKISNRVTTRLAQVYREADARKRAVFDQVLAEWVRSSDPSKWFDAKALIREFQVCSALPAMREALALWRKRLVQSGDPQGGGQSGITRSQALSAVHMLEPIVKELDGLCRQPSEH